MKKAIICCLSIGLASAFSVAGGTGQSYLTAYAEKLNGAGFVQAKLTFQQVGQAPTSVDVALAKPNLVRIETASQLIVADGTNVTRLDKTKKTYYTETEKAGDPDQLLAEAGARVLKPFFDKSQFNPVADSKDLGQVNRQGVSLEAVKFTESAGSTGSTVFYIDPSASLVKQAQLNGGGATDGSMTTILNVGAFVVGKDAPAGLFAFNAPSGSRMLTADEINGSKWYTDLSEAEKVATKSHRKVFVDFFATWCGPCKMLQHDVLDTEEFKKMSKYFVFCRVDVDEEPTIAAQYDISAMPTQMVLDETGAVLDKIVGYGGPDMFYQFINKWAQ